MKIKYFLVGVVSFLILLAPLSISKAAYSKAEQNLTCGLPLEFITVDFSRLDPPYPWQYSCLSFNPWEDSVKVSWVNLFLSYVIILTVLVILLKTIELLLKNNLQKEVTFLIIIAWLAGAFIIANDIRKNSDNKVLTENEAITLVKRQYSTLQDYPSDNLPPKTIRTKKAHGGWYIQFRKEGSGMLLLEAQCFLVRYLNDAQQVQKTGEYSNKNDKKDTASIENCQ
ncbi:hypothetical protein HY008_00025 [Candidatus Woesebacteria bacterium]|nr:hypothetical protein [Candidatus Woesebacteria bacterium]